MNVTEMNYRKLIYLLGCLTMLSWVLSCRTLIFNDSNKTKPLATVNGENLFINDIPGLATSITQEDSVDLIQSYVKQWVEKRVFEHAAQEALGDKLKGIDKLVEEYRKSLIAQYYEREHIAKVDETVTSQQIEEYYKLNKNNMILNNSVVKAQVIRIPKAYPDQKQVVTKFMSGGREALNDLISIADRDDLIVIDYNNEWSDANRVFSNVPMDEKDGDVIDFIKRGVAYDKVVGNFRYMLKVNRYALIGDYMPMDMMEETLRRSVILERKRIKMEEIRTELYNKALGSGLVNIREDFNLTQQSDTL